MCGFFSCLSDKKINNQDLLILQKSANLLMHRGRDANSSFDLDYCYFKSFRHKILDLSDNGNQPLLADDRSLLIVFNGIIFNHKEIRNEIIEKYNQKFISDCDTETIIYGFKYFGNEIFKKLNGFWSLIIYDLKKNEAIVSRDRFGVKPLYFIELDDKLIFSSEIKSLKYFLCKTSRIKINLENVNTYIKRGWLDHNNQTLYSQIKSIEPGFIYKFKLRNFISKEAYWNFPEPKENDLNLNIVKDKLIEITKSSILSDVPLAILSSSGLDSNSILSILSHTNLIKRNKIESFTAIPENSGEDIKLIEECSKFYNIKNHQLKFNNSNNNFKNDIDDLLKIQDEPFFNSSHLYQYKLRKFINQKNFHVILTGDGSDEVFAGYYKVYFSYLSSMFNILSKKEFITLLKNSFNFTNLKPSDLLKLFRNYSSLGINKRNIQENNFGADIINNEFLMEDENIFPNITYSNLNDHNFNYDFFYELMERFRIDIPHVVRVDDRISSYYHICSRPVFLNHELLELVWSYHFQNFMKNGNNKNILRESLRPILPKGISEVKTKIPRPGDNALLSYKVLNKYIVNMLKEEGDKSFFKKNLVNLYENDANKNNKANSYVWLRYYLFNRWITINNLSPNYFQ